MVPVAPADIAVDATGVVDVGQAWFELAGTRRRGRVLASFRRAVYVDLSGTALALVADDAPPGPIHLRVRELPRSVPDMTVTLTAGTLIIGDVLVELDGTDALRWRPPTFDAAFLRHQADAARRSLTAADRSDLAGHPAIAAAEWALGRGDLPAVVDTVAGLGSGLTPAGDDVLGGLLVVLHTAGCDERALLDAVSGACTHAISRSFLAWAARGQAVEPVHLLLAALARGDRAAACSHQEAVLALGHTSGADLLLGLRLGLGALVSADRLLNVLVGRPSVVATLPL